VGRLTERYVKRINPALVELVHTRSERYDELSDRVAALASDTSQTPAVCVIRPPAGSLLIGQMENRRNMLAIAGSVGLRTAWNALTGEDPELLGVPIAQPRAKDAALAQQNAYG
jgi:hypothetical protein